MPCIGIIGGGAAGMMAALTAAENPDHSVYLFEKQPRVGKKLLATGNGRCNLSNLHAGPAHYFGDPEMAAAVLDVFSVQDTLQYFRSLGLLTAIEPDGRIYPYSNHAASVLDTLRFSLEQKNVCTFSGQEVTDVARERGQFALTTSQGRYLVDKVIFATGGAAAPSLGGSSKGYALLQRLGHTITPLAPSLVQLKTDTTYPKMLKGVKAEARVSIFAGGVRRAQQDGEVLFTAYGISGPAIFTLSRYATTAESSVVELDFLKDLSTQEIFSLLRSLSHRTCEHLLTGILGKMLGQAVVKSAGIALSSPVSQLPDRDLRRIVSSIKHFRLSVTGNLGFSGAQVTAGGADTGEFDPFTLQSKRVPGLYAAGEVLNVDGACGGYNLQWAWSSGRLAGKVLP